MNKLLVRRLAAPLYQIIAERPLLFILSVALAFRALATIYFSGAIDPEGVEYVGIAQNLSLGNGYVGLAEPESKQLFFQPLFPFAIAAVSLVTRNVEVAGRLISVMLSALAVLPVYIIALKMYDRRTAAIAGILVACHPYLIYMSTTVHVESSYLTFLLSALCLVLLLIENPTPKNLFCSGAAYGLAYLVRAEAAAFMIISATLVFIVISLKQCASIIRIFGRVSLMIGAFAIVASPYVIWLSMETGQFRIEGKSSLNLEVEKRLQRGENLIEASFAVDASGKDRGVYNQPNLVIIQTHSSNFKEFATLMRGRILAVTKYANEMLAGFSGFGSPPLFALASIGLFARPWSRYLAICQLQIVAALTLMISVTFFSFVEEPRFYILLVPLYCIWGSVGLQKIARWGMVTGSAIGLSRRVRPRINLIVWTVGLGSILLPAVGFAGSRLADERATRPIKMAGEWLHATMTEPIRLLDSQGEIAFYAKALPFWLPYCDENIALKYIEMNKINVVVVRKSIADLYPYLRNWVNKGIPDPRAKLVYALNGGTGGLRLGEKDEIMIYEISRR